MAKIIIDNQEVECRDGIPVLQAGLDAGWDIPHYCYHPGLSIGASCRLCLMEMKMPNPRTGELEWSPKLVPSCQTPVRDGMEVRFDSDAVRASQRRCLEFFLLNHPLDCPVCDQAGECLLQDYSLKFGNAESRMVDEKQINPKKDIGPHTLIYQDRCVLCTRCVRFAKEVAGTSELCLVNRGTGSEIDVFPGKPLDNPIQGNVVDICPVGSMLDKDFLFSRRVWELTGTPSICPGCSTGCAIRIDHADGQVYRLKPRYNPVVNAWWICDEGRYGYKHVGDDNRLTTPRIRRGHEVTTVGWDEVPAIIRFRFEEYVREHGGAKIAAVVSPFMACEEAWLLAKFIREVAPKAVLASGPTPVEGEDQRFPLGAAEGAAKFTIRSERCPNRRGIEMILAAVGGKTLAYEDFVKATAEGEFSAAWIVGGSPRAWIDKAGAKFAAKLDLLVVQDMLNNALTEQATILLPACAWAEREGCFVNVDGRIQPFERVVSPPDGAKQDGQYLFELAGYEGLYRGDRVRELMAESIPEFAEVFEAPLAPAHAH